MKLANLGQINILVIESNEGDCARIRQLLRSITPNKYHICCQNTYETGLEAIQTQHPDIILLDYHISDRTGLELLAETQSVSHRAPVIIVAAHSEIAIDVLSMQAGAADYLDKERIDASTLERAIRHAMERQRSAQKRSEDSLHKAEQELRQLVARLEVERGMLAEAQSIAKIGSWEMDYTSNRVTWSDETYRIFDSDRTKFDGTYSSYLLHVHPDDREAVNAEFTSCVANHTPYSLDHRIVISDGSIKTVHERGQIYYDDDGNPVRAVGTCQDITLAKEAEKQRDRIETALRKSEKRYQSVVEKVESLMIHDLDGRLIDANQNACASLGYTREELLKLRVSDFEIKYEETNLPALWQQIVMGEKSTVITDGIHKRKDGTIFPVEVRVGLLEKNGSTLMVAVARDVSRRREAEEERDRFFTLSPDMMAIIGADGYVKRLNPAFAATLGHTETEMMSRPILDFVHPDDLEATVAEIANIYSGLNPRPFENRNICSDGSYKWLRWTAAPYADMCYSVAHDITAVKLAAIDLLSANEVLEKRVADRTAQLESSHAEMAVAKKEAERANAAKSDFLSRMSHELRTPMNSIMGFAQIIEMDEPEGKHATRVEHILRGGQHLLRLINEVLDLARVESGRLELSLEPVSLRLAIRNAVEMMQPLCEQRNQQIICNLGDCDNHYVQVDQQRFSQVLLNLLSNATKYNPVGGSIVVTCEPEIDGYLRFSIRDTGIGIPSDQISKIFEPFERLGDADNKIEGTGLGLALAKRLIENMGGKVKAESVVGVGSLFTVDLVKAKCPSHEIACNKQDAMFRCIDPRQKVILYIEDNEANLHLISDLFSRNNRYHLLSAQTGLAGLEIAHKERPDLILLDLHLPGFSGNEVLIRLKEDVSTRKIPVVIVSADATEKQKVSLLKSGAADYVTKPIDIRLLTSVLDRLLPGGADISLPRSLFSCD